MCLAKQAKIKKIEKDRALVDFGGGVYREISLGMLCNVKKNDYVLIHAGFAIGKIRKEQALKTKEALRELKAAYYGK